MTHYGERYDDKYEDSNMCDEPCRFASDDCDGEVSWRGDTQVPLCDLHDITSIGVRVSFEIRVPASWVDVDGVTNEGVDLVRGLLPEGLDDMVIEVPE